VRFIEYDSCTRYLDNECFFSGKGVQGAGKPCCKKFVVTWMAGKSRDYAVGRGSVSQNIKFNLCGIPSWAKSFNFVSKI